MDFTEHDVEVLPTSNVAALKIAVCSETGIPTDQQRLLCRGTLLKDYQSIEDLGLREENVLNLIGFPRREDANLGPPADLSGGFPRSLISRRRRRLARSRRALSRSEQLEVVRQNLITIEDLLKTRTRIPSEPLLAFNFEQRQLHIGQWVDVKDTVDQWLEAQVIELRSEHYLAYVHYNGWPDHWDEWIQVSSPRIQPLRTHTVQPITASMSSPSPSVPPDSISLSEPHGDLDQYFMQSCALIEQVSSLMERHYALCTLLSIDQAEIRYFPARERFAELMRLRPSAASSQATGGSDSYSIEPYLDELSHPPASGMTVEQELNLLKIQLAPILDRTGRLMTDLASLLQHESRGSDDFASLNSSIIPGESDRAINSSSALQIPVMPGQHELNSTSPSRGSPGMDVHLLMPRGRSDERDDACWRQVS